MALGPGTSLGDYELVSLLGAGGMGQVFKARDRKLGRDVALKVLPEAFTSDPLWLARFEREARALASLNHANIATLHALEESKGIRFLVMELVPGETLAARIGRGPLPLEETLSLFQQIAEALEAAHEKGVVHRDLKPANINVTPEGQVKVLDFGLAKTLPEADSSDLSQSPTRTKGTLAGVILGTARYMSPEQARGKETQKATDIWSFGCCLFEALSRRPAFVGETVADLIGQILERDPEWQALFSTTFDELKKLL
ncbi:MAG TPA: serine/threonine-protein kinase, partial [Vicinamibacteria bacterium]